VEKKSNVKVIVLAVLLLLSVVANFYQGVSYGIVKEESAEKYDNLSEQHKSINNLYDESLILVEEFKADNHQLSEDLISKVDELKQVKKDIEQIKSTVKNKSDQLKALQKKYAKIVSLNRALEDKIDEILVENKLLFEKNDSLKENVEALTQEKSSMGDQINSGSKIKSEYVTVSAFKKRSNGKFKETIMAKRVNKIDVSLTLLDNPISPLGEKTVYLRIIAPSKVELGSPLMGSDEFREEGKSEPTKFSAKKVYTYTGKNQDMTISYEEESEDVKFEKGMYLIEIYVDNYFSGRSSYYLK
jgi:hypothetical protein